MFNRCRGEMLSDVMFPPHPPQPTPATTASPAPERSAEADANQAAVDFVCEEDVRLAMRDGRKVVVSEKTIITPSARELGEAHKVFVEAGWRF